MKKIIKYVLSCHMIFTVLPGWASGLINNASEEILFMEIPTVAVAARHEESQLEAAGTVYVISEDDIKRYGWRDLQEILTAVPNMDLMWQYNWLNGGQRGFTGNFAGTLLLIDGREVQNLLASEAFMSNDFPAHRIKRVEILQGPNSTLYGGNATQGVINVVTKFGDKGDQDLNEVEILGGGAGTEEIAGIFKKTGRDAEFGFSGSRFKTAQDWKELAVFAADNEKFSRDAAKDPVRYRGTEFFRNHEETWTSDAYIRYRNLYGGYNYFKEINTSGLEYVKYDYSRNEPRRGYRQGYVGYKFQALGGGLNGYVEYQNVLEDEAWLVDTASNAATAGSYDNLILVPHSETIERTTRDRVLTQIDVTAFNNNRIIVGYDWWQLNIDSLRAQDHSLYPNRTSDNVSPTWPTDKEKTVQKSVYVQDTLTLWPNRLKLTAGLRANWQSYTNDSILPRASLVYTPWREGAFKFTYGRAFRPPNIFEYVGVPQGTELDSQIMSMYEVNYSQVKKIGRFSFLNSASAYNMQAENLYSKVWVGGGGTQLTGWKTVVGGKSKVIGFEDLLKAKYGKTTGFLGFRYVRPDKTSVAGQDIVADVPPTKIKAGLSQELFKKLTVSLFVDHWDAVKTETNVYPYEYITDASGNTVQKTGVYKVPAWTNVNLNVNVGEFEKDGIKSTLSLYVENLLNSTYYHANIRGSSPVQFLQPPRTLRAKLSTRF